MCRWLAYRGGPIPTSELVLHPKHSLVAQSLDSTLGAEPVNGDGFGLGWYPVASGAGPGTPAVFRSIEPAWHDANLREVSQAVVSPLFFSHVRAAAGPPIQQTNCHPFRHENWLFMHNGYLNGFDRYRREAMLRLDAAHFPLVQGTTDSEVLFHLALANGLRDDPPAALATTVSLIEELGRAHDVTYPVQMTVAVTNGSTIWAFRYSTEGRSRSLFHSADVTALRQMYPDLERLALLAPDAHVVVSEPLTDLPGAFVEVPESSSVMIDAAGYHHQPFLAPTG